MKLYFAGSLPPKYLEREAHSVSGGRKFLATFADKSSRRFAQTACLDPSLHLFIDSGAYSVWTKNKHIDIEEYVQFCLAIKQIAKCPVRFAALDVIPGSPGEEATTHEREIACEKGWENYEYMRKRDIECLMTFHQFETRYWLKKIADSTDYMCVSPRKSGVSYQDKLRWLKDVFRYIGPPMIKVHGLGVASAEFMEIFPFYSVDNTAWLQGGRVGNYMYFDEKELRVISVPPVTERTTVAATYRCLKEGIRAYAELESRITEVWQLRGEFWDEPRIENMVASNPRFDALATYDWQDACGRYDIQPRIPGFETCDDDEVVGDPA